MVRRIKKWDVQCGTITTRALSEFVIVSQIIVILSNSDSIMDNELYIAPIV